MVKKTVKKTRKPKTTIVKYPNIKLQIDKEITRMLKKKGLEPEVKLFDNTATVANLSKSDGPAYSTLLNNVVGGSSESQRDGNIIFMKRMKFKFAIAPKNLPGAGSTLSDNRECMVMVRVLIVMDTQTISDTTPALSDVIASSLSNDLPIISPQTILQQKRFKILYSAVRMCEIGRNYHVLGKTIKLSKEAIYNGTAATDIQRNGIYLFAWYNDYGVPVNTSGTNDGPRFTYWSRLEYTDC